MWQIPVLLVGLVGVAAVAKATKLKPLPADIAGMIRSGLMLRNESQLLAILGQLSSKYPRQVAVVQKAHFATRAHNGELNVPADIDGMYQNALATGDSSSMSALAKQLDVKYHFLATHLQEVASLLSSLTTKAAA